MAARRPKSKGKSNRGGARPGAGRKTKPFNELRAEIVAESERLICSNLPSLIANMLKLANGGYQRVEDKYEPGDPAAGGDGAENPTGGLPLVLVERKVSLAEPDRAANQYLIDRVLGKPRQSVELFNAYEGQPRRIVIPADDDRPEPNEEG